MSLVNILGSKNEQQHIIGSVETDSSQVVGIFLSLVQSMGMTNPSSSVTSSKKGVKISKKGSKYTLTLEMFEPPIEVIWKSPLEFSKVLEYFDKLSNGNSNIGWVNILNLSDGSKYLQFATN